MDVHHGEPIREGNVISFVLFAQKEIHKIFVCHRVWVARIQRPRGVRKHAIDSDTSKAVVVISEQIVPRQYQVPVGVQLPELAVNDVEMLV